MQTLDISIINDNAMQLLKTLPLRTMEVRRVAGKCGSLLIQMRWMTVSFAYMIYA
jgi:hypothetical protein